MRIEVTVEGQEPFTHRLSKDKTLLGSGADCDVVVEAEGVSRKHIQIIAQGDQFFVVDQGSKNGTFLNEERLVPGQRAEFTSFFPIRVGALVMLALLSDEEGGERSFDFGQGLAPAPTPPKRPPPEDSPARAGAASPPTRTQMAFPSSVRQERRQPGVPKKDVDPDALRMKKAKVAAFLVAVLGSGAFFMLRSTDEVPVPQATETTAAPPKTVTLGDLTLSLPASPGRELADRAFSETKCGGEVEKAWCDRLGLPLENLSRTGVVVAIGRGAVVAVLPQLSVGDLWKALATPYGLAEANRTAWPLSVDPRDVAALFYVLLDDQTLALLTEETKWLVVAFDDGVSSPGSLPVLYADLTRLNQQLSGPTRDSVRAGVQQNGPASLGAYSGFFRTLE